MAGYRIPPYRRKLRTPKYSADYERAGMWKLIRDSRPSHTTAPPSACETGAVAMLILQGVAEGVWLNGFNVPITAALAIPRLRFKERWPAQPCSSYLDIKN